MSEETRFFDDGAVVVTSARAVLNGTTYAMANITSVRSFVEKPTVGILIVGIVITLVGLSVIPSFAESAVIPLLLGLAIVAWYFLTKPKHWVRIGTAGAETNAAWSHDAHWTAKVVAAINQAIIARG